MTPITSRPIPDGYTEDWNSGLWNVGFVFRWSEFFREYVLEHRVTVKPGECLSEAFKREFDLWMTDDYTIFFVAE